MNNPADTTTKGTIPAGTVVHLRGIPFRLSAPAEIEGTLGNFILAEEHPVERHYSSADVSGA